MKKQKAAKPLLRGVNLHIAIMLAVAVVGVIALGTLFSPQPATPSAAPPMPITPPVVPAPEQPAPEPPAEEPEPVEPVPEPEEPEGPEPIIIHDKTPLDITKQGNAISFQTNFEVCEDQTLEWNCLTEEGITTCIPSELSSGESSEIIVLCVDFNEPDIMIEYKGVVQ